MLAEAHGCWRQFARCRTNNIDALLFVDFKGPALSRAIRRVLLRVPFTKFVSLERSDEFKFSSRVSLELLNDLGCILLLHLGENGARGALN